MNFVFYFLQSPSPVKRDKVLDLLILPFESK